MTLWGPPTSVVPVSIAAYDAAPEDKETEDPCAVNSTPPPTPPSPNQHPIQSTQRTKKEGKKTRTSHLKQPKPDLPIRNSLIINLALKQRRIHRSQRERAARLERPRPRVVQVPRQLHAHERLVERPRGLREGLPEGLGARGGNLLPGEPDEA